LLSVRRDGRGGVRVDAARRLLAGRRCTPTSRRKRCSVDSSRGCSAVWARRRVAGTRRGAGQLTAALVARLRRAGGEVCGNARVERVVVRELPRGGSAHSAGEIDAKRAVLRDVGAPRCISTLCRRRHLSSKVVDDLGRFVWDNATVKVDWNLDTDSLEVRCRVSLPGTLPPGRQCRRAHESTAELARGLVPETPFLIMGQQSMTDPTRMPPARRRCGPTHMCPARSAATRRTSSRRAKAAS